MSPLFVNIAVEDALSEAILRAMVRQIRPDISIDKCFSRGGYGYLKRMISGFNNAAKINPYIVLTDLDKAACASGLISQWLPHPKHDRLLFRVAVREVESWLLAHRIAFSEFFEISKANIPLDPDSLADAKQELMRLARKSKSRVIREGVAPRQNSTAQQGPDYNALLIPFIDSEWNCVSAAKNSPSLMRTMARIAELAAE